MIILDTNVVSELMRRHPQPEVLTWIDIQLTDDLHITAVTEAEVRAGIALLPQGERRQGLAIAAERMLGVMFAERILSFDSEAAQAYAVIVAVRRSAGRSVDHPDCLIAAIARSRGASVATRNVRDFQGSGIEVINPWSPAAR